MQSDIKASISQRVIKAEKPAVHTIHKTTFTLKQDPRMKYS